MIGMEIIRMMEYKPILPAQHTEIFVYFAVAATLTVGIVVAYCAEVETTLTPTTKTLASALYIHN